MPTVKPQPLKARLRKAAAMAKRLDEYIAAGSPAGAPPPRRSGMLQGTHAALDVFNETLKAAIAAAEPAAPIHAQIKAADGLIAELKDDPPAPLTASLAERYRDIVAHAQSGYAAVAERERLAGEADAD